jgi:tetratricopeptide (TPR) repeat protein
LNSAGEAEGGLNNKNAVILKQAIEHYKSTREWLILPRNARGNKGLLWRDDQEKEELNTEISDFEKMTQSDPDDPTPWSILAIKYELLGKYKDVERALKVASELQIAKHPDLETADWEAQLRLGKLYFAALSNAIRGKGIPIWGHSPSRVTPESLGYTIEQVRSLAEVHLKKTDEVARSSGLNGVINLSLWLQTKLVRLAIEATTTLCESAFNEYDEYSIEEANQT